MTKERRPLSEGITQPVDPEVARKFIHGDDGQTKDAPSRPLPAQPTPFSRSPLSTRIRTDFTEALKRASLERQLNKIEPYTLQDILEEAIEPWLRNNSYLP